MKCKLFALAMGLFMTTAASAQMKLSDVVQGRYSAQRLGQIEPMADGESYIRLTDHGQRIVRYAFKTGLPTDTIFDANTARGTQVKAIQGYVLSPDEQTLLVRTNTRSIYRHSYAAEYLIYSVRNNTLTPLSQGGPQQQPQFSPNGEYIAFVREGNLFVVKRLFDNAESQVTKDGKYNEVINGLPDWVNEEEFSTASSFSFSADSKMLAWVRYDERAVPLYTMPMYSGLRDGAKVSQAPEDYTYKYSLAGGINASVTVHSFDIKAGVTRQLDVPLASDSYIPRLVRTNQPDQFIVATLNRRQDQLDFYAVDARSTVARLVARETHKQFVTEKAYTDLRVVGDQLLWLSDRTDKTQIYATPISGGQAKPITNVTAGVNTIYAYSDKTGQVFFEAYDGGPLRTAIWSTDLRGRAKQLTHTPGQNTAIFSATGAYYLHTHSTLKQVPTTVVRNASGKQLATFVDNKALAEAMASTADQKSLFTFTTPEGHTLNGWMVRPRDFSPTKRYPVILYQYSGPGSQMVADQWNNGFLGSLALELFWAEQGYIVVCVDGRGTGGRGAAFEKSTYMQLGMLEAKDQVYTAQYLAQQPYVDAKRLGMWGWSFGGFNTLMAMADGQGVFKAGVAVAAVSSWRFYDTIYTERYMRKPQENAIGYAESPLSRVSQLSGSLLIIHGSADDNVHLDNFMAYTEALVQAGKTFDMHLYTDRDHSIYGGNTRLHLFQKITDHWNTKLK